MEPRLPIAAITDEFSPDLLTALKAMAAIGMTGVELRVVFGKNIVDVTSAELEAARKQVADQGMKIISIASPLLKCVLPNAPPVDTRFQHDVFASKHTFEQQPQLTERAFEIAKTLGARIVRVFSYWRTTEPDKCFEAVVDAVSKLAEKASRNDLIIGLENEHACNISTGADAARVLSRVDNRNLQIVWDPANALVSGENPFPEGYRRLPVSRIIHVHAKDCHMDGLKPVWGPLGTRAIDWKGQVQALLADGYRGYLSLETHWPGPGGDKMQASTICGWNLRGLAAA